MSRLDFSRLKRYPESPNPTLQAWDAGDERVFTEITSALTQNTKVLVIGDLFGAITLPFLQCEPAHELTVLVDSYCSKQAIAENTRSLLGDESARSFKILNKPEDLSDQYDLVIIRVPKILSYFEDLLCHVSNHLSSSSRVICVGMVKHLPQSVFSLIESTIGKPKQSLAIKKARLIEAPFERQPSHSIYPEEIKLTGFEKDFTHPSNLFSRTQLDIGTRFLLEHLPEKVQGTLLDLGCANGILGIAAKQKSSSLQIIYTDDSFLAVESAGINYKKYFQDQPTLVWDDCFSQGSKENVDFILCNPPFHQNHTLDSDIAKRMFLNARSALKPNGSIRIVGNRHLPYFGLMKSIFGNCELVAENSKFKIFEARKNTKSLQGL